MLGLTSTYSRPGSIPTRQADRGAAPDRDPFVVLKVVVFQVKSTSSTRRCSPTDFRLSVSPRTKMNVVRALSI